MTSLSIAVIIGSLRKDAFTRRLAEAVAGMADGLELDIVEIGDLPFYNPDLEGAQAPQSWLAFRDRIKRADGVLFITPEYNRSIPAVLKNAIDVASRPYGAGAWSGTPGAVISLSPGALGAFGANHHLRQSLTAVNVPTLQAPEAYIGGAGTLFNEDGGIAKEETKAFLAKFLAAFAAFVTANRQA